LPPHLALAAVLGVGALIALLVFVLIGRTPQPRRNQHRSPRIDPEEIIQTVRARRPSAIPVRALTSGTPV